MGIATNTTNLNLDLIDREEQEVGDSVNRLRLIQNSNMEIIDAYLYSASIGVYAFTSISANYTALVSDSFIQTSGAATITVGALPTGKQIQVGTGTDTISILGSGVMVNGFSTTSAINPSTLGTLIKTETANWLLY